MNRDAHFAECIFNHVPECNEIQAYFTKATLVRLLSSYKCWNVRQAFSHIL